MTPSSSIRFGTDGWRALIADDFTFFNVRVCATALANQLINDGKAGKGAVVGYDTRFVSDEFAKAVAAVLATHGIHVWLCDRAVPTPAVSYAVTRYKAACGVVITASHNPAEWNGFKVKSELGGSASQEQITGIEQNISCILADRVEAVSKDFDALVSEGIIEPVDLIEPYLAGLTELVDISAIRSINMRVVVDAMYGAGSGILPRLLTGGKLKIVELNSSHNPAFPGIKQPEPVETNLARLKKAVCELKGTIGIALDGDADRVGIVDENGQYLNTLEVFSILAHHILGRQGKRGAIACTITMSDMIDKLGELYGVPIIKTSVGFKYVGPAMIDNNGLMGGEESGGYAFRNHIPERDGVLSALIMLDAMVSSGKNPSALMDELVSLVGPHSFQRIDLKFEARRRQELLTTLASIKPSQLGTHRIERVDRSDGTRFTLEGGGWAMARFSGTEPLLRLYCEAQRPDQVERLLTDLRDLLRV